MRLSRKARSVAVAGALAVSITVGACGGDSDTKATPAPKTGGGGGKSLTIKDFAFSPQPLEVPKGTVVKVTNTDDAPHTATADEGGFDTGNLDQGQSKDITLSEAGEIAFFCSIHDYMRGVIRVTP